VFQNWRRNARKSVRSEFVSREFFEKCKIALVFAENILRTLHSVRNIHIFSVNKGYFPIYTNFLKKQNKNANFFFFLGIFLERKILKIFSEFFPKFLLDFRLKFIIVHLF